MRLWVPGIPQPKGSTRSFVVKGHAVTTSAAKGLKAWEQAIRFALITNQVEMIRGPVCLQIEFLMPMPKSKTPKPNSRDVWKRYPIPDGKPDLSKLVRGAEDALNNILIEDDAKVMCIGASKQYTDYQPGVWIDVQAFSIPEIGDALETENLEES